MNIKDIQKVLKRTPKGADLKIIVNNEEYCIDTIGFSFDSEGKWTCRLNLLKKSKIKVKKFLTKSEKCPIILLLKINK